MQRYLTTEEAEATEFLHDFRVFRGQNFAAQIHAFFSHKSHE